MLTKSPANKDNFFKRVTFTNSAREGWGHILRTIGKVDKVLLPSYIGVTEREGSGIFDPVSKLNKSYDFYLLNEDLTVNLHALEQQLKSGKYKLLLLVHYFGFMIRSIVEISKLCKENNVILVEDCAHLFNYNLFEISKAGTYGDFAFYSLHKNFALEKGGMLVQNNLNVKEPDYTLFSVDNQLIKQLYSYDAKSIAHKRIENFKILEKELSKIKGVIVYKTLGGGDIPNNFPIIVQNGLREKLYFWLIENSCPVISLYYRLIPDLQSPKFNSMLSISNNILNLPVHQDTNAEDINRLIKKINSFYESR